EKKENSREEQQGEGKHKKRRRQNGDAPGSPSSLLSEEERTAADADAESSFRCLVCSFRSFCRVAFQFNQPIFFFSSSCRSPRPASLFPLFASHVLSLLLFLSCFLSFFFVRLPGCSISSVGPSFSSATLCQDSFLVGSSVGSQPFRVLSCFSCRGSSSSPPSLRASSLVCCLHLRRLQAMRKHGHVWLSRAIGTETVEARRGKQRRLHQTRPACSRHGLPPPSRVYGDSLCSPVRGSGFFARRRLQRSAKGLGGGGPRRSLRGIRPAAGRRRCVASDRSCPLLYSFSQLLSA
ncbi:ABC1 family protein, partial [Toxoplasma gondii MAS]